MVGWYWVSSRLLCLYSNSIIKRLLRCWAVQSKIQNLEFCQSCWSLKLWLEQYCLCRADVLMYCVGGELEVEGDEEKEEDKKTIHLNSNFVSVINNLDIILYGDKLHNTQKIIITIISIYFDLCFSQGVSSVSMKRYSSPSTWLTQWYKVLSFGNLSRGFVSISLGTIQDFKTW